VIAAQQAVADDGAKRGGHRLRHASQQRQRGAHATVTRPHYVFDNHARLALMRALAVGGSAS
jgi:hypothetical protein